MGSVDDGRVKTAPYQDKREKIHMKKRLNWPTKNIMQQML
jgi:hypothetical protein